MPDNLESLREASEAKLARLRAILKDLGSCLIAYSGGVDSTFLLKVGTEVLGERCVGLVAHSASMPEAEQREARDLAEHMGARLVVAQSNELDDPRYAANPVDRCYYCKLELFSICERKRVELGLAAILDGFNADDRADWRPGHRAGAEKSVRSVLAEAGLTKNEIRAWSQKLGLPTWDKPQMACLSSRLPYGTPVTAQRLGQIGGAEADLRGLGLRQLRVRWHGDVARIEVAAEEYERLLDPELRHKAVAALKRRGFHFVSLDLEPFRSGRMNEAAGITARST
ncbi:MAG: ATP-dependent sacrificial sulfur transferase LarE [Deltaproteobacteria bacterium]|nr:ATP-dependent sacrificial sulfur transferase LarE [Deltaproteobacteria bacterium]